MSSDGVRGQRTHEALKLKLHGEARDAHSGGVRVLSLDISLGGGEVNESSVAREHIGDKLVVLVFVQSAGVCLGWEVYSGHWASIPKRFVYGACDLSIVKIFGTGAGAEQWKIGSDGWGELVIPTSSSRYVSM